MTPANAPLVREIEPPAPVAAQDAHGTVDSGQLAPSEGGHPAANVHRMTRLGLITVVLVFGGFGIWATFAPLAGAVIGQGVVKVDLNRKTVQHLEGGIVSEILVRDGDHVSAGQALVVLQDARISASVDLLQGQLDAELARAARLQAERDGFGQLEFPERLQARSSDGKVAELLRSEATFFETKRQALLSQIELLRGQIAQAQQEVTGLSAQLQAEEKAFALMEKEIAANQSLAQQHFIQGVRILELQRQLEDYNARRGERAAEIAQARQRIADLELRIVALQDDYVKQAAEDLTVSQAKIFDLEERLRPSQDAQRRMRVVAPISGTVVNLKVFTIGGVVAPRETILEIVPDDNPKIIETQIGVDAIDDVHVGQEADIRLSAYKRRETPLVQGVVTYVSADRLVDSNTNSVFYIAHVQVDGDSLREAGDLKVVPGMPAEVFIRTNSRTALDYLLAPVTASLRRSFREP
jgi:HlyD family type I secretion membrane fusion protein